MYLNWHNSACSTNVLHQNTVVNKSVKKYINLNLYIIDSPTWVYTSIF